MLAKRGPDYSFDFGKNLTVLVGHANDKHREADDQNNTRIAQDSTGPAPLLKLFLQGFRLGDAHVVHNLRNVA